MPITLDQLVSKIEPASTILLFGSGSSIPSGAPSVDTIISDLAHDLSLDQNSYTLGEISGIYEQRNGRKNLITKIRKHFKQKGPTGGLINVPLYDWRNIYTTNYDELIESAYSRHGTPMNVYASNFDFTIHNSPENTKLFKLHGTIGKDDSDGYRGRIIITENDFDHTEDFRQALFDHFKSDVNISNLIIIGHSLADPDIKGIVNRALSFKNDGSTGTITLLMFSVDEGRASLFEQRGITVCFGGIDEFFANLAQHGPEHRVVHKDIEDPLDSAPALIPVTKSVRHEIETSQTNFSAMFNGWPASYADICHGLTFDRTICDQIFKQLTETESGIATLLGVAGVGKTTLARIVMKKLYESGWHVWEHSEDHALLPNHWHNVAKALKARSESGVLLIDEAHKHLYETNTLIEKIGADADSCLSIIMTSSKHQWNPRIKSPIIYNKGKEYPLSKLDETEIHSLLDFIETKEEIRPLVEQNFGGFSRIEKRRRLVQRCESDFFVCLKNIFASESFDDIILREFAILEDKYQEIYRFVAAMENSGIRVHRQLAMRVLGISADAISSITENLEEIVTEYSISNREGIYGWKVRHSVIASIIARYKFSDPQKLYDLFSTVIGAISPTYEIEIRSIRELCNLETGIPKISDKKKQNILLQKMISIAPAERVPRHRLIRNLIDMGRFEDAETEIRIFENDFTGSDGPLHRYKVKLLLSRADKNRGLLAEDRETILGDAKALALQGIARYPNNKHQLRTYCEVGVEFFKLGGDLATYDDAISRLKDAEQNVGDPEISRIIANFENQIFQMTRNTDI